MQELKKVEVTVVQVPKYVKYECPHCGNEAEVSYSDFEDEMTSNYWSEWEGDTVMCDVGGEGFEIEDVEVGWGQSKAIVQELRMQTSI